MHKAEQSLDAFWQKIDHETESFSIPECGSVDQPTKSVAPEVKIKKKTQRIANSSTSEDHPEPLADHP
ncbi:hypothetical protein NHQ30_004062 [Ciborinia camelliae]|nr:hypothetical protein NHQ30_004062 [Ciborinia camelliae]